MITNQKEYETAVSKLAAQEQRLEETKNRLASQGLNTEEIKRATDPIVCFGLGIKEEIEDYQRRGGK